MKKYHQILFIINLNIYECESSINPVDKMWITFCMPDFFLEKMEKSTFLLATIFREQYIGSANQVVFSSFHALPA